MLGDHQRLINAYDVTMVASTASHRCVTEVDEIQFSANSTRRFAGGGRRPVGSYLVSAHLDRGGIGFRRVAV